MIIISKTKVGGLRAKDIVERLPFDEAIVRALLALLGDYGFYGIPIV